MDSHSKFDTTNQIIEN
jgi:hypothetical protein